MITFLPLPSFEETAKVLDMRRLGCQRGEALLLLKTLTGEDSRWINHPIVAMWRGYEYALAVYGCRICAEWKRRGYRDRCLERFISYLPEDSGKIIYPPWIGLHMLHASHRSALLAKNTRWYSRFGWKDRPIIKYYWPL